MAVTQTDANKQGLGMVARKDTGGYYYFDLGGVRLYIGSGDPDTVLTTAPKGSVMIDIDTPAIHIADDAAGSFLQGTFS